MSLLVTQKDEGQINIIYMNRIGLAAPYNGVQDIESAERSSTLTWGKRNISYSRGNVICTLRTKTTFKAKMCS